MAKEKGTVTVGDIYAYINKIAPFSTQESWDNSGLLVGDANSPVTQIGFVLDITPKAVEVAKKKGMELIISHHPVIFEPAKQIFAGSAVYALVQAGIHAICVHTPLDCAYGGVNDVLAQVLRLEKTEQLGGTKAVPGILRGGFLPEMPVQQAAAYVKEKLNAQQVQYSEGLHPVAHVAVGGGACASLLETAVEHGCDTLITGEAKHHDFLHARELGINLISAGHFETENPVMIPLATKIKQAFSQIEVMVIKQESPAAFC